ncbi:MAG: squalene synthase HpnC [Micromonosporaceae bacterium]|nr:squalene synthase HpnC [Micromonosporaceae bacterium]
MTGRSARPEQGGESPGRDRLGAQRRAENFPVALRVLPAGLRRDLVALYEVARVIDDLGDEADGDRLAQLDAFAADLATIWQGGTPREPVLRRLAPTVRAHHLAQEPFDNLIEANRWDQKITSYQTYQDLLAYCALSAEPVGRIVLAIFHAAGSGGAGSGAVASGAAGAEAVTRSDRVCTALQIIEHCQDVAEDRRAGRVYLPREDMRRYGVTEADLDAPAASPGLRRLIEFEADRAGALLAAGAPLVRSLHGWAKLAVGGYVAGGRAAIDGLRRVGWDVLSRPPGVRRIDVLRHLAPLVWR